MHEDYLCTKAALFCVKAAEYMVSDEIPNVQLPLRIVVAVQAADWGIGYNGQLPWPHIAEDLAHFKRVTTRNCRSSEDESAVVGGKPAVIMGRHTWLSIPPERRPLSGRLNIVLTRQKPIVNEASDAFAGAYLANSLNEACSLAALHGARVAYVIGGASVFRETLAHPACDRIYLTRIRRLDPQRGPYPCDVFMPAIPSAEYVEDGPSNKHCVSVCVDERAEQLEVEFLVYRRQERIPMSHSPERERVASDAKPSSNTKTIERPVLECNHEEQQYLDLVRSVIGHGYRKADRTGVGTLSLFGAMMRFSLRNQCIPLLTTKRVFWRGVVEELLWFLRGSTDATELSARGVHIWDGNASRAFLDARGLSHRAEGDLGPVYGFQWRHFGAKYVDCKTDYRNQGVDQIRQIVETLKTNPDDRRMLLCAWNPLALPEMALPPCHVLAQFYVANGELSCLLYQRSCDLGLGVPFNIASYSLLTMMLAHVTDLRPGELVHTMGDVHVYLNHVDALKVQLGRQPRPFPHIRFRRPVRDIDDFCTDDIELIGYYPHQTLRMDMAV